MKDKKTSNCSFDSVKPRSEILLMGIFIAMLVTGDIICDRQYRPYSSHDHASKCLTARLEDTNNDSISDIIIIITDGTKDTANILYGDGKGKYRNRKEIDVIKNLEVKAFRDSIYGN